MEHITPILVSLSIAPDILYLTGLNSPTSAYLPGALGQLTRRLEGSRTKGRLRRDQAFSATVPSLWNDLS